MSGNITRFQKNNIYSDSLIEPLSYKEWLKRSNLDSAFASKYSAEYMDYVNNWYVQSSTAKVQASADIDNRYVTFIQDTTINYESDAQERYIKNSDLSDPYDIEIALPYISQSIKDFILKHKKDREDVKYQKIKYNLAGTKYGIDKILRNIVYTALQSPYIQLKYKEYLSTITIRDIVNNLVISINEYFDLSQDYYDNDSTQNVTIRDRFQNQVFDRDLLTDIDKALSTLSTQETTLSDSESIELTTTDLQPILLDDTTTIQSPTLEPYNYTEYGNTSDTNYDTIVSLMKANIGCDQHIITFDADNNYTIELFNPKPNNNNNLLNIYYPTINYISSKDNLISSNSIGIFSRPDNIALQRYYSHDIIPVIQPEKASPEKAYVLPDIYKFGSIYNNTISGFNNPITHIDRVTWLKTGIFNGYRSGFIKNSKDHNKFTGYISTNEVQNYYERGVSRSTDAYDFWTGNQDSVWSQADIFPQDNPYDIDYDARLTSTLPITSVDSNSFIDNRHKTVTDYGTDVFGNEWFVLKTTDRYDKMTADILDVTPSTELSIQCDTLDVLGFGDRYSDVQTLSGGSIIETEYVPQKIITDWFVIAEGSQCQTVEGIEKVTHCHRIDGKYFNIIPPEQYTWISATSTQTGDDVRMPVGWWDMTIDGATVLDSSGNNQYGTVYGIVSSSTDVPALTGESIWFDGSSGYISTKFNPTQKIGSIPNMAVSCRFKPYDVSYYQCLWYLGGSSEDYLYMNITSGGYVELKGQEGDTGAVSIQSISALSQNQWYTVTVTRSSTDISMYINGMFSVSSNNSQFLTDFSAGSQHTIGATPIGSNFYNGLIDDLAIWDESLSTAQVTEIYTDSLSAIERGLDGGSFNDTYCDVAAAIDIAKERDFDINNRFTGATLDKQYYTSVLTLSSEKVEAVNSVFGKQNTSKGELWCREAVTGKLHAFTTYSSVVGIDVQYDVIAMRNDTEVKFHRIKNSWQGEIPTLVTI